MELNHIFSAAIQSFPRSIILTDSSGKAVYFNDRAKNILNLDTDALGQSLDELVHGSTDEVCDYSLQAPINRVLSETNVSDVFIAQSGGRINVEYSIYPLFEKKKLVGFMLRFKQEALLQKRRDQFLATLGHELKTPLTIIKAYNHLLKSLTSEESTSKVARYFQVIDDKVNYLHQLIEGMLDTIKLGAGKMSFADRELNFDREIDSIVEQLQKTIFTHKLSLSGQTGAVCNIDAKRLFQVVSNLIKNAVKYSPKAQEVDIFVEKKDAHVILQVTDYGYGISQQDARQLFEPFFRSQQARSKQEGLGMGLFLSKQIVNHYDGKIWFASEVGKGSSFFIKLPIVE